MKLFVQRVLSSNVKVSSNLVASISKGELVLVSFTISDTKQIIDKMIDKLLKIRIFEDENGLTNLNIASVNGEILAVSQFSLYASLVQGNRPSFINCLNKEQAEEFFNYFKEKLSEKYEKVQFGIFHADMKVELINDGPFSIELDSKELGYER